MSISESVTKTAKPAASASVSAMSDEDAEELRLLDAAVDRIRKHIPETPYILTIPSDSKYHVSRHEAESWHRSTPFAPNEEHLQYMSFIYREHGDSCIIAKTEVDEERERREKYMKANGIPSGRSTPLQSTGPKKKITLAAYKNKQAGGQEAKQAATLNERKKEPSQVNGDNTVGKALPTGDSRPAVQHGQKRSLDDAMAAKPSASDVQQDAPPPKKARTSPPPPEKPTTVHPPPPEATPYGLPPLLSPPVLPDLLSSDRPYDLPPMLSPTLPPNIESELAKLAKEQRPDSSSSSEKRTAQSSTATKINGTSSTLGQKEAKLDGVEKGVAKVVKKGATSTSDEKPDVKKAPPGVATKISKVNGIHPASQASQGSVSEEPSLIVKLKYGKKNRSQVERYLKLPPSRTLKKKEADSLPKKDNDRIERESTPNIAPKNGDGLAKPAGTSMKDALKRLNSTASSQTSDDKPRSTPEKRPRPSDDAHSGAPPGKRPKALSTTDLDKKPRTPTQTSSLPSPAQTARSSAQKPHLQTPRKDLKGIAMTRTASTDSAGAAAAVTPKPSVTTPQSLTRAAPTSAPAPTARSADAKVWYEASKKWNDLGRRLKHAADAIIKDSSGGGGENKRTAQERKRAAVTGVESVMAYMLAYVCMDMEMFVTKRQGSVEGSWATLVPMWRVFERGCKGWEHLDGLCLHLGVVICARINAVISERLALQRGRAVDSPADNISAGDFLSERGLVGENWQQLQQCSRDANSKLPVDALIEQYPKTWGGRLKGPRLGCWESLSPGELKGEYCLPVTFDTTPVQAVRMGVVFLKEWMAKEGLDYELQLKL